MSPSKAARLQHRRDDAEALKLDEIADRVSSIAKPSSPPPQATSSFIRAVLVGDTCAAAGLTISGREPILKLCRALIAAGHNPTQPLQVYRGEVMAVAVRSIGAAAQLTVEESGRGTIFRRFRMAPQSAVGASRKRAGEPTATDPAGPSEHAPLRGTTGNPQGQTVGPRRTAEKQSPPQLTPRGLRIAIRRTGSMTVATNC